MVNLIESSPKKRKAKNQKNAFSQIRTDDLLITSEVPYQLGHKGSRNVRKSPGGESNTRSQDYFEVLITVSRLSQLGHREESHDIQKT